VTAVIVVSLIALLLKYANAWVLDIPNERSLHTQPIPRFGGVVMIAVGLGVVSLHRTVVPGWAGAVALSLLSFLDDRKSLPIILRLSIHVLTAVLTLWGLLPVNLLWLLPLLMLVVVWSTNLFNFMDGADGLAGGMALIGFAAYGLAAFVAGERSYALTFFVIAGAAGGFLFFNFHPARIFLGDGGSIPLGFLAAIWGSKGSLICLEGYGLPAPLTMTPFK
jgi:UDP-N-acetylmuramyl pentapeptide phosphotransferase/UDP-N-acetylglucosamine-1-phosphate transferase